ncbi:MAG: hypothetical protein CM1200mP30_21530 [Pseudomonadota bacterium]|nr:MAG: hypothetical protein CM1200mP30_21530 [Pseudomonadota bacterium]
MNGRLSTYRSGDFEKAAEQFAKQDNTRANFNRGNALAFAGRLQDAIDSYEKVLSDNPQHKDAKFNKKLVEDLLKKQNKSQQNKQQKIRIIRGSKFRINPKSEKKPLRSR